MIMIAYRGGHEEHWLLLLNSTRTSEAFKIKQKYKKEKEKTIDI